MTHKQYKAWTLWLLIITVTALVLTAAMLSLKRSAAASQAAPANAPEEPGSAYYTPNPAPSQGNSENSENNGEAGAAGESGKTRYLVTLYRGHIGVFQEGRTTPVLTADTEVYLLPEADIELLKKGIPANTLHEARRILEDYD